MGISSVPSAHRARSAKLRFDEYFSATVEVAESKIFFTWILNFSGDITISSPAGVKDRFKAFVREAYERIAD